MSDSTVLDLEQVPTHQFRKLGAVAILPSPDADKPVHYDSASAHTSAALLGGRVKSLLAVGSHYGLLFVVAPSLAAAPAPNAHGLYVARTNEVVELIDADRAAQEEEQRDRAEERSAKQADVPLSDKVFTFVPVQVGRTRRQASSMGWGGANQAGTVGLTLWGRRMLTLVSCAFRIPLSPLLCSFLFSVCLQGSIWHISLNPTDDFLLVCTTQHLRMYSTAQLVAGSHVPLVELEMDMVSCRQTRGLLRSHARVAATFYSLPPVTHLNRCMFLSFLICDHRCSPCWTRPGAARRSTWRSAC
jgi:hypothetical protein